MEPSPDAAQQDLQLQVIDIKLLPIAGGVLLIGSVLVSHQVALAALSDAVDSDTQILELQTREKRFTTFEKPSHDSTYGCHKHVQEVLCTFMRSAARSNERDVTEIRYRSVHFTGE